MDKKKGRWQLFSKKLKAKYRLIIMNDSTFEKTFSFRLSRLNVFIAAGAIIIFLIITTSFLIAYTPLREYVPGYGDVDFKKDLYQLAMRADSMEQDLIRKNLYIENLKYIIEGKDFPKPEKPENAGDTGGSGYGNLDLEISPEDSALRYEFESAGKYNITFTQEEERARSIRAYFFFVPIKGIVTSGFNPKNNHFGVDIVAQKNESIKSTLDGVVLLSAWTLETGYVIAVQHKGDLVSIYKHNSALLKRQGEYVKAGDPIAIVGESGELSIGPHLHFELWHNGVPINPREYMSF